MHMIFSHKITLLLVTLLCFGGFIHNAKASEISGTLSSGTTSPGNTIAGVLIGPPQASPNAGSYSAAQNVVLSADGADLIRYTTDGSTPDCTASPIYSSAIPVTSSQTIIARACYADGQTSDTTSFAYIVSIPPAPQVTNTSSGGGSSSTSSGGGGGGGGAIVTVSADANNDGKVDISDFVAVMADWGKSGLNLHGDLNHDGSVDIRDFVLLMAHWSK